MNRKKKIILSSGILAVFILGGTILYFSPRKEPPKESEKRNVYSQINASYDAPSTDNNEQSQKAEDDKVNAPEVIYTPARNWTPTLPKVSSGNAKSATTQLLASDITRLQTYTQYLTAGGKKSDASKSFADMYATEKSNCEGVIKKFSPVKFGDYKNAKVKWLTDPRLIYTSAISQYCNRGVLQLTFYEKNKFGLKINQTYETDVEYRTVYSLIDGKAIIQLQSVYYLSDFKVVK